MRQSLSPNRRLPHQPRLGVPAWSLAVLEITGVGGGSVGERGGGAPSIAIGAGSRTVERRRGGSGSAALGAIVSMGGGGAGCFSGGEKAGAGS
jgi:hypothetical protein